MKPLAAWPGRKRPEEFLLTPFDLPLTDPRHPFHLEHMELALDEAAAVARDGMLKGINWDATIGLADAISIPVIASGGLASIEDIRRSFAGHDG